MYRGDIRLGDTLDIKFTTRQVSGAPTTLAGSPVISAYPGNSTTELTAGITLSVDFDTRTGLNNVRVVATSGNGYATATNYDLVITTGTVNSVSVVGEVIGSFSIECRSALMPTTAARTLVVDAAGLADANVVKLGPTGSGTAQTAKDVGGAVPAAAAGASGGLLISGSNAGTTTLAAMTVTGTLTVSDGIVVTRSSSNTSAISATGNGTGHGIIGTSGSGATGDGIKAAAASTNGNGLNLVGAGTQPGMLSTGGGTGHGISAVGGGTSGSGLNAVANTSGDGVTASAAGTSKHGINATGAGNGYGLAATGNGTGDGIRGTSGAGATGNGINAVASSTNGIGLSAQGNGNQPGMQVLGGATGHGLKAVGGGTSGDAFNLTGTSGHGINAMGNGTSAHGIVATGGSAGTSDGIKGAAGTGGVDIRGNLTGNITGNLSGSAGSVTGAVGSVTGNVGGNVVGSVASVTAAVAITSTVKKNQALAKFQFLMTDSTTHAPKTGVTVTCTRSIDNGAFAAGTLANVAELSNGIYTVDFGAGDLNGNVIILRATGAASDDTFERVITQP